MRVCTLLLLFCLLSFISRAQTGTLSGKVTDESNNQPLTGATVALIETAKSSITETNGDYKFSSLPAGIYTLQVSFTGYETKKVFEVEIGKGEPVVLNITLTSAKNKLADVTVTSTSARKENLNSLLVTRRNAAMVSDGISADLIRKSPDKNTSDVLKRISGTSVQDNKYVVVRGMNDRYNEAMLNGIILPSSESDRKTFAFDIFPSEVVDNITIYKSAEPDCRAALLVVWCK